MTDPSLLEWPECCHPGQRFFDVLFEEYQALAPYEGKLSSFNLLHQSLVASDAEQSVFAVVGTLRRAFGINAGRLFWGVKRDHRSGSLAWELYFPRMPDMTVQSVSALVAPVVGQLADIQESIPYIGFSIGLEPGGARKDSDAVGLFLNWKNRHGYGYKASGEGIELANVYTFFPAATELDDLVQAVRTTAYLDLAGTKLTQVLIPQLAKCRVIAVARKRRCDALYFHGVRLEQFEWFLERFEHEAATRRFVAENRELFTHLRFDVSFDYRVIGGKLAVIKSAYYGSY